MSDSSLILSSENLTSMVIWLSELVVASWALSYGAEHLSAMYGAKFAGRTILSVATSVLSDWTRFFCLSLCSLMDSLMDIMYWTVSSSQDSLSCILYWPCLK